MLLISVSWRFRYLLRPRLYKAQALLQIPQISFSYFEGSVNLSTTYIPTYQISLKLLVYA